MSGIEMSVTLAGLAKQYAARGNVEYARALRNAARRALKLGDGSAHEFDRVLAMAESGL